MCCCQYHTLYAVVCMHAAHVCWHGTIHAKQEDIENSPCVMSHLLPPYVYTRVQMPRTGAYIMVRLAPSSSCSQTEDSSAAGAAAGNDNSTVCVSSMMAQEGT